MRKKELYNILTLQKGVDGKSLAPPNFVVLILPSYKKVILILNYNLQTKIINLKTKQIIPYML